MKKLGWHTCSWKERTSPAVGTGSLNTYGSLSSAKGFKVGSLSFLFVVLSIVVPYDRPLRGRCLRDAVVCLWSQDKELRWILFELMLMLMFFSLFLLLLLLFKLLFVIWLLLFLLFWLLFKLLSLSMSISIGQLLLLAKYWDACWHDISNQVSDKDTKSCLLWTNKQLIIVKDVIYY